MATEIQTDQELLAATFLLGGAAFGVDTAQVQEVVRPGDITPVRHAPPHVVGIRNLRGKIVTVIDLRLRLNLGTIATSPENRILIVECLGEPVGLLVDQIADTITVNTRDIQPPPPNVHGVQGRNLRGVCRGGGRLIALLDVDTVLQTEGEAAPKAARESMAS